ncbi:MAG: exo-alpha-sialidase, partial [Clostridia bacterium]|nr:exo-alpha-sialidase [Clostridia bacterium]
FGSVVYLTEKQALLAVTCDCETERKNITVKMSCDNGATWPVVRTIDAQRGGYSDIAADEKNERIYVLYEDKFGGAVYLARFTPAWLED